MADDKEQAAPANNDQAAAGDAPDLASAIKDRDAAIADRDGALAKVEEQAQALTAAEADLGQAKGDLETVTADRDEKAKALTAAEAANADLTAKLAEVTKQAAVSKTARPAKLRDAGPMKDSLSGDDLLAALKDGAHEIVFSNGRSEIDALEPLQVAGPAWQKTGAGVVLTTPVTIKPDRRVTIAGFALLDGKGKQIAWAPMRVPATVQANQEMRLDRQIVFP